VETLQRSNPDVARTIAAKADGNERSSSNVVVAAVVLFRCSRDHGCVPSAGAKPRGCCFRRATRDVYEAWRVMHVLSRQARLVCRGRAHRRPCCFRLPIAALSAGDALCWRDATSRLAGSVDRRGVRRVRSSNRGGADARDGHERSRRVLAQPGRRRQRNATGQRRPIRQVHAREAVLSELKVT